MGSSRWLDDRFRFDRLGLTLGTLVFSMACLMFAPKAWPAGYLAVSSFFVLTGVFFVHQFDIRGGPLALGFLATGIVLGMIGGSFGQGMGLVLGGILIGAIIILYSAWIQKLNIERGHRLNAESEIASAARVAKTQAEELGRELDKGEMRLKTWLSLVGVVRGCSATLKFDRFAPFVLDALGSLFPDDRTSLWIGPPGGRRYQRVPREPDAPDGLDRLATELQQNILVPVQEKDYRFLGRPEYRFSGTSALVCPLLEGNQVYGNLRVTSPLPDRFGHEDMSLLSHIAGVVSMSAINVRLYERTEELALTDSQTGMFKRYHFEKRFREESRRATRHSTPMALLLFDIDHFKRVNDTYGHPVGDKVLSTVGRLIREVDWGGPLPCRWGGEEFLLALPDANLSQARARAAAIMERIKSHRFSAREDDGGGGSGTFSVTVSAGVAIFPGDTGDPDRLFQICDRRLYVAKNSGRDWMVDHD